MCKIVDRRECDELPLHPQLSEEDEPANRPGAERSQRLPRPGIVALEVRLVEDAEPVDLEGSSCRGDARERSPERLLARDEPTPEYRDEHRHGERHAAYDQNGAEPPRAQPRTRDGKRGPRRTE